MKKPNKNFFQQLQQRLPDALKQERVIITPIDRLATQGQEEKPQVDKTASTQTSETTNRQGEKETSGQNRKITSGEIVKYTTHLRPVTVKTIKRYAVEHDLKDYEIVQEALDRFFNQAGN